MKARRIIPLVSLALTAPAMSVVTVQSPAYACIPDNHGHCIPAPPPPKNYKVSGTDGTLAVQSQPKPGNILRWLREGDTVSVSCQVNNGASVDGIPSHTWDRLASGGWVFDHYITTPPQGSDGFSPGVPHCATTSGGGGAPDPHTFVALGDSYSAGLGSYDHTGFPGDPVCQRSTTTYSWQYYYKHTLPGWLGGAHPDLVACWGAPSSAIDGGYQGQPRQDGALGAKTKLVTLTIGGNDPGIAFANILGDCLGVSRPGDDCWLRELDAADKVINRFQGRLVAVYRDIEAKAPGAHIVVLTYPDIFPPKRVNCGTSLGVFGQMGDNDLAHIHRTWAHLNSVIKSSAASAGVALLDEQNAFAGHDFCRPRNQRYANGLMWQGKDHSAGNLGNYDNESYHPTIAGYGREASDLAAFIAAHWH